MKSTHIRILKRPPSELISRILIWPMVVAGWGLAVFAIFLTLTNG